MNTPYPTPRIPRPARFLLFLVLLAFALGCSPLLFRPGAKLDPDDGLVMFKVRSSNALNVSIGRPAVFADMYNGRLDTSNDLYSVDVDTDSTYVVLRLPPGEYCLQRVYKKFYQMSANGTNYGRKFASLTGAMTAPFEVKAGRVVYIGDLEFVDSGDQLAASVAQNPDDARAYLAKANPEVAGALDAPGATAKGK